MKKKLESLVITTALWMLKKCHYNIPVIRPNIISREFSKRAIAQEKIDYLQLQEWALRPEFKFDEHIERKLKEALAMRIAGDVETFTIHTPDGIIYKADVIYTDMKPWEQDLDLSNHK